LTRRISSSLSETALLYSWALKAKSPLKERTTETGPRLVILVSLEDGTEKGIGRVVSLTMPGTALKAGGAGGGCWGLGACSGGASSMSRILKVLEAALIVDQLAAREAAWQCVLNVFWLLPLLMTTLLDYCPPCATPGRHVQQGGVRYVSGSLNANAADAKTFPQMNKRMLSV
jgi:hypothetical protein